MLGCAGNDLLESGHESLLTKVPLTHIGNHRLPVGTEPGFGVTFLGTLDVVERRVVVLALAGIDDPQAQRPIYPGRDIRIRPLQLACQWFGRVMAESLQLLSYCPGWRDRNR